MAIKKVSAARKKVAKALIYSEVSALKKQTSGKGSGTDIIGGRFIRVDSPEMEWFERDWQKIPNFVVTKRKELSFQLDYPFQKPLKMKIKGVKGITLHQIVRAIRRGFRTMYAGSKSKKIRGMLNREVEGKYGHAFHVIGDLAIERIVLKGGKLDLFIGS